MLREKNYQITTSKNHFCSAQLTFFVILEATGYFPRIPSLRQNIEVFNRLKTNEC